MLCANHNGINGPIVSGYVIAIFTNSKEEINKRKTTPTETAWTKKWPILNSEDCLKTGSFTTDKSLLDLVANTAPINAIHSVICCTIPCEAEIEKKLIDLDKISKSGKDTIIAKQK